MIVRIEAKDMHDENLVEMYAYGLILRFCDHNGIGFIMISKHICDTIQCILEMASFNRVYDNKELKQSCECHHLC